MIEEKGVEGMEEEIATIEPNVEIEGRGSMMGKEEEGKLSCRFHSIMLFKHLFAKLFRGSGSFYNRSTLHVHKEFCSALKF